MISSRIQEVLKTFVWPLFLFTTLTVALTYPVSVNPGSMIIGRPFEDAFEYIWYLSWYKVALFDTNVSPLFQPDIFYPTGWNLGFSAFPPIHPVLAAPFTALFGAVRTYNLFIMFTCVFAACGAYIMVKALGGDTWGGVFAGIAFAFYPQHVVYLGGHLNFLVGTMWLPWLFYGLIRARQTTSQAPWRRTAWMAFAGLSFAMTIGGSWHFLYLSGIGIVLFLTVYLWPELRDRATRVSWIRPIAALIITTAIIIGPFLINASVARRQYGPNALFSFASTNHTSVSLERLLVPDRDESNFLGLRPCSLSSMEWTRCSGSFRLYYVVVECICPLALASLVIGCSSAPSHALGECGSDAGVDATLDGHAAVTPGHRDRPYRAVFPHACFGKRRNSHSYAGSVRILIAPSLAYVSSFWSMGIGLCVGAFSPSRSGSIILSTSTTCWDATRSYGLRRYHYSVI